VTAAQALAAGLSRTDIRHLCRARRWRRLALGTYYVSADRDPSRRALIRAAVASFGPRASAVLDTAAELCGIAGIRRTEEIHVSVPVADPRAQRAAGAGVVLNAGWTVLRFTWADTLRSDYIPYVVRDALRTRSTR